MLPEEQRGKYIHDDDHDEHEDEEHEDHDDTLLRLVQRNTGYFTI